GGPSARPRPPPSSASYRSRPYPRGSFAPRARPAVPSSRSPPRRRVRPLALAQHREELGHGAAQQHHPGRVQQFARGPLQSKAKELLPGLLQPLVQIGRAQLPQIGHAHASTPIRWTNLVLMGSLCPARVRASRATSSVTPPSSNIIRPRSEERRVGKEWRAETALDPSTKSHTRSARMPLDHSLD